MAEIKITFTGDVTDPSDGETTLREALALAAATPENGTLVFAAGAGEGFENGGTVLLKSSLTFDATGAVRIEGDVDGNGTPDVTIDVQGNGRVASVLGQTVIFNGVTLTGGDLVREDGGGLLVGENATVALENSIVTGNTGSSAAASKSSAASSRKTALSPGIRLFSQAGPFPSTAATSI